MHHYRLDRESARDHGGHAQDHELEAPAPLPGAAVEPYLLARALPQALIARQWSLERPNQTVLSKRAR